MPSFVEIVPAFLEKKIFKFRQCVFSLFSNYLSLKKGVVLQKKSKNKKKLKKLKDGQIDAGQQVIRAYSSAIQLDEFCIF